MSAKNAAVQVVEAIQPAKLTLAEVRERLDGKRGKRFWRSLDELTDSPAFQELVETEFPRQASAGEWTDAVSRRGFMKVMGASFALAGLVGCTKQPDEPIFPYIKQPEDLVLGKTKYFATAYPFPTGAVPVLVKSDAFRPIKIEGNPEHPASMGKTDAYTQATILDLYDPDRSKHVRLRGEESEFGKFQAAFAAAAAKSTGGAGIVFLSETITSPTLAAQWKAIQAKYPAAKLVQYEPVNADSQRAASKAAFGEYYDAQYKLEDADVVVALDADFLGGNHFPGFVPMAAGFAEKRRFEPGKTMNRLYVIETMPTVTGFKADHRLALKPSDIDAVAVALAGGSATLSPEAQKFVTAVLKDIEKAGGRFAVVAGPQSSKAANLAAMTLNAKSEAVKYTQPVAAIPTEQTADLKALVADMNAGKVSWLVILGGNPVYNAPVDLNFVAALNKVPNTAHLSAIVDETSSETVWHIPAAHYLESWTDTRAVDGTISVVQPMIDPLYGGRTAHDVLNTLLDSSKTGYDSVVETAKTYISGDFATGWRKALHDGWVEGTAFPAKTLGGAKAAPTPAPAPGGGIEISFKADSTIYDGRFANNGWMQETPKQVTNLAWDNAALMSMDLMARLGIEENQAIELTLNDRTLVAPVLMVPGHPDNAVTLHVGFGRKAEAGRVAGGVGVNAFALRTADQPLSAAGLTVKKGQGKYDICVTKSHAIEQRGSFAQHDLEHPLDPTKGTYSLSGHEAMERAIIRYATVDEALKDPKYAENGASGTWVNKVGYNPIGDKVEHDDSFYPDAWRYDHPDPSTKRVQYKWGMSIDLNSCIGCNACVVGCYAENNIPVIGREQVKIGRIMQWIRVDTYFEGDLHAPKAHFQPMLCQHCESAGCEQVCPVGATVHTPEGINTMVYNRCVGTRYCSNNCPYKVRRFNFLLYADYDTESLKMQRNPDVSVRSRGVMEKCSYCLQRIEAAKIEADKANRAVEDGEILTACQQVCPASAITFGDLNDPKSAVAKKKAEEREYAVLEDLNYRPRTTYTAGVINPNPELA